MKQEPLLLSGPLLWGQQGGRQMAMQPCLGRPCGSWHCCTSITIQALQRQLLLFQSFLLKVGIVKNNQLAANNEPSSQHTECIDCCTGTAIQALHRQLLLLQSSLLKVCIVKNSQLAANNEPSLQHTECIDCCTGTKPCTGTCCCCNQSPSRCMLTVQSQPIIRLSVT